MLVRCPGEQRAMIRRWPRYPWRLAVKISVNACVLQFTGAYLVFSTPVF